MSTLTELVEQLLVAGAELSIDDGKLRVRAPDGVLTPERLATLRDARDELLRLLPAHRFEAPMSAGQEGLWFIQTSAPDSSAYNVGVALHLESAHDHAPALRRALQRLVDRHMLLRSRYEATGGRPRQLVDAHRTAPLTEVDAAGWTREQVERAASEFHLRPFDLAVEGGFRACLLRRGPGASVLVLCVHHVAVDGWSIRMIGDELLRLLAADGQPNPLPPVRRTYLQFVAGQRELLASRGDALRDAAVAALAGAPYVLELPTDRPRPPLQTFRGATHSRAVDPALVDRLRALGRAEGATLYTIFLAAFQALLFRYSGQEDFCVGSAAALREREELASVFGYMVNAIVLRAQISADDPPPFSTLLQQTRERVLGALELQEYPFPLLAKHLLGERDPSRPPVFQVMFSYQRAQALGEDALRLMTGQAVEVAGVRVAQVALAQTISEVDLILEITEHAAGLELGIRYNTDLFDAATVARMAGHLETLLAGVVVDPRCPVSRLPLLTDAEREQQVVAWNRNDAPFSSDLCLHQMFEAQVDRDPEAIALVDFCNQPEGSRGVAYTYGELERRANQVAHRLRRLGVGPEVLVSMCMERGADLVVCLLGILKAGGAYVPLDPEHPRRRLAAVLADAAAPVVITRGRLLSVLPEVTAQLVDVDRGFADEPVTRLDSGVQAGHLAAVLYTSGSTGEPNGAVLEHRGLVNSVEATVRILESGPGSRLIHILSFNFDGALAKLFWMLACGGTVQLAPRDGDYLGKALIALIERERSTHTFFPPAMLAAMPDAELPTLHTILVGGERCTAEVVARWGRSRRLINIYGPTETSILVTSWRCVDDGQPPPIGRLIPNIQAYVLDRWGQVVPAGVAGELHLAGVGVGRGYHNRPDATARKYSTDPFRGGRFYRTGDLVRWRVQPGEPPTLEFIRRIDNLVKLRGYRLELGEIEAPLRASPLVREAVVTVVEGATPNTQRLVAYVTPARRESTREQELAHVASWDAIYEKVVAPGLDTTRGRAEASAQQTVSEGDMTLDLRGWKNSYTGEDIDPAQMRVWAESTVARILDLAPRDVLEIGCGSGMLLARIAPRVRRYRGTDLASYAITKAAALKAHLGGLGHVEVSQQPAHDFAGLEGTYDTAILNSVVQYFPSAAYLRHVLAGLLARMGERGAIFLGDLRSLPLLETYHASVEHHRTPGAARRDLHARVGRALVRDNELVLDPRFFTELRAEFPQIVDVEVAPKRGAFLNELTQFRYDVTLRLGAEPAGQAPHEWRDAGSITLEGVRAWLAAAPSGRVLGLRDLANARLAALDDLRRWLHGDDERPWQPPPPDPRAWDPEALFALEDELGCRVRLSWAAGRRDGSFDAAIAAGRDTVPRVPLAPPAALGERTDLASDPLQGERQRELVTALRRELRDALPHYLIPSAIVVLPQIPININGKVDVRALPPPEHLRDGDAALVEPRDDVERGLADVWCTLLGLDRVGIDDDFFEVGGDSLLAVQAMSRLPAVFGVELPVRALLEKPTIREVARHVELARATLQLAARPEPGPARRQSGRL
uniref:Non-ribosomal peptide synthase n=1 Tax=Nannocystis sp. MB1016 TaxID=1696011 RepID=A0A0M4KW92_9BACT|nr:non-ribosomal peptide synthase [Nannocystis sp. MB1016]